MAPEVLINGDAGERRDLIMISDADIAEGFDGMDSFDKIKTVTPQSRQWKGPHDLTRYEVEEEGKDETQDLTFIDGSMAKDKKKRMRHRKTKIDLRNSSTLTIDLDETTSEVFPSDSFNNSRQGLNVISKSFHHRKGKVLEDLNPDRSNDNSPLKRSTLIGSTIIRPSVVRTTAAKVHQEPPPPSEAKNSGQINFYADFE